jgi:2-hydroxy-3-keto-5-methylthiopentenyl-1-phosphate phosphatase
MQGAKTCTVLSDFDGTIVNIDTGAFALEKFASGDWRALNQQMVKREITFEECIQKQFGMVNAPIGVIVKAIDGAASLRPHFVDLVNYCKRKSIQLIIVSGGLDFYIRHVLDKHRLKIEMRAPKCDRTVNGLSLKFPPMSDLSSFSFKDDLVRQYRRQGHTVLYVGDGYADYYALKEANVRFALAGSTSAKLCSRDGVSFQEISDFLPVIRELKRTESEN